MYFYMHSDIVTACQLSFLYLPSTMRFSVVVMADAQERWFYLSYKVKLSAAPTMEL